MIRRNPYINIIMKKTEALLVYKFLCIMEMKHIQRDNYHTVIAIKNILKVFEESDIRKQLQDIYTIKFHVIEMDVLYGVLNDDLFLIINKVKYTNKDYKNFKRVCGICNSLHCSREYILQMAYYMDLEESECGAMIKVLLMEREIQRM